MTAVIATPTGQAAFNLLNFWFKPGIAGGQVSRGGINAGDAATIQGNSSVAEAGGRINMVGAVELFYTEGNTTPGEQFSLIWEPTFTTAGAYIGGLMRNDADITYTNPFYIYASVLDRSFHTSNAGAGFQAFTLFNALPTVQNGTSSDLVQQIILNDGGLHQRITAGTSTTAQHITVSSVPAVHADVSGAVMNWTLGATGLQFAPKWNCVAGGTVDLSNLSAVDVVEPTVALFQTNAGTRRVNNISGINFPNMQGAPGYILDGEISVIRSLQNLGTDRYFLRHLGTAPSTLLGNLRFEADLTGVTFGASDDAFAGWAGAGFLFFQFNSAGGASGFDDQLQISNPAADRIELTSAAAASEINFVYNKGAYGEGGAAGNNKWRFVAQAETVTIGGGFSQFLQTQAANDTIDAVLSQYFGWAINGPTPTIGTGSIVDAVALGVGQAPTSGTNRYGVLILSAPAGGTINEALRIQNGRTRTADFFHDGTNLGFYSTAPIAQQLAVPVTAIAIHAALVALGLIT